MSIVVATRNRRSALERCVESIRAQRYPREKMELIIVNDGSNDETPAYLSVLAEQEPWIKVVTQTRGWQASARNQGILRARGALVAITDDDCTVAEDWLLSLDSAMRSTRLAGVGGHVQAAGNSLVAKYLDHVRVLDPPLLPNGSPQQLVTANTCFRRSALERVGLFDETFTVSGGEDTELALRMRRKDMKLGFVPSCRVTHWFEPQLEICLGRFYRYGSGVRHVFEKYRSWESWIPRMDAKLQTSFHELSQGRVQHRAFREVADPALRPWFGLLAVLHRFAFLSGYLALTSVDPLITLPPPDNNGPLVRAGKTRREQTEAILQALSAECWPPSFSAQDDAPAPQIWRDQCMLPPASASLQSWVSTLVQWIGLDVLIEIATTAYPPPARLPRPDALLAPMTRRVYRLRQKRQKAAYARHNRQLLDQLTRSAQGLTFANVTARCDARAINVNRFIDWYEALPGAAQIQP
jgi:GT2 family glycosyltransferase